MATNEPPPVPPGAPPPPPPPPTSPNVDRWRDLKWSAVAVYAALSATGIAVAYALVTQYEQRSEVSDIGSGSFPDLDRLTELNQRIDDLNDAFLALAVITGVTFIVWMWRAAKNNAALGRPQPRFGPGWAIGGWLIPLANLVIPVLMMQDLWRGSDASVPRGDSRWKIGDRSVLVGFWWGLLIFGRVLLAVGSVTIDRGTLDDLQNGVEFEMVGSLGTLAAVVLAVLVVRNITKRQQDCLLAQQTQLGGAQTPTPSPGV